MSVDNDDIYRSRRVREILLDLLFRADGAGSGFGFSFDQLRSAFGRKAMAAKPSELRRELNDMEGERLLTRKYDADLEDDYYRIAPRGRDFKRAGCPWEKIDEFSGGA